MTRFRETQFTPKHSSKPCQFLLVLFVTLSLGGCVTNSPATVYDYGTASNAARLYYHRGWQQIMDLGLWSESERSFRKALVADPDFLIGKSLVARISGDVDERLALTDELEQGKDSVDPAGRLLLDVFLINIQSMNMRDQGIDPRGQVLDDRHALAEANFSAFLSMYPEETYIRAEYIEHIHARHGAQAALDKIRGTLTPAQSEIPFFLRYRASLHAELGDFDTALEQALAFETVLADPDLPEQYVLYADIFARMGRHVAAKKNIEKALALDAKHLIAKSMQARIDELLQN